MKRADIQISPMFADAGYKFSAEINMVLNYILRNTSWHIIMIYISNIYITTTCTTLQALTLCDLRHPWKNESATQHNNPTCIVNTETLLDIINCLDMVIIL